MANTLYITEYESLAQAQSPLASTNQAEQSVSISDSSAASAAFQAKTQFVRVVADASCCLAFGTAPTAVATEHLLPANVVAIYGVPQGQSWKLAAITGS